MQTNLSDEILGGMIVEKNNGMLNKKSRRIENDSTGKNQSLAIPECVDEALEESDRDEEIDDDVAEGNENGGKKQKEEGEHISVTQNRKCSKGMGKKVRGE